MKGRPGAYLPALIHALIYAHGALCLAPCVAVPLAGCAGRPAATAPPSPPLHTEPLVDLAPAAGLAWLVLARPRDMATDPSLIPAIDRIVPARRFGVFAQRNGVDVRAVSELVVARYPDTTLTLARAQLDPARVEKAWGDRMVHVEGRSVDRASSDPLGSIVRTWGSVGTDREQLAVFGREAVGLELGRFGPLRAAELFAQDRLKRASPALRAEPLARAAALLGDAPVRAFAPGPFTGELAGGLGGLLGASTAVAGALRVAPTRAAGVERPGLALTVVLVGGWGADGPVAADRLLAAFAVLADSGVGRLLGLDRPLAPARAQATSDSLSLEVTIDADRVAEGLHAATGATIDEIMGR